MDEQKVMLNHLQNNVCPHCFLKKTMNIKAVYYTDPLGWGWECSECKGTGIVGYDSISRIEFPPDKLEEWESGVENWREFIEKHGVEQPRKIIIKKR